MFRMFEMKKRGLAGTLMLTAILLTFMFTLVSASAVTIDTNYDVTLVSNIGNSWTYSLTWNGADNAISHWVLAFCGGLDKIVSTDPTGTYGKDPTTLLYGIKWEIGSITAGVPLFFTVTLDADYPEGLVPVSIKAGPNEYVGYVGGPLAWSYGVTVSARATSYGVSAPWLDWDMVANALTDNTGLGKVEFSWYGPFATEALALAHTTDYVGDDVDNTPTPFESVYPNSNVAVVPPTKPRTPWVMHDNDLGWWYVEARFYILPDTNKPDEWFLCGYASNTIDLIVETPWFTSLPFAMLVTVGAVLFLKKKGRLSLST